MPNQMPGRPSAINQPIFAGAQSGSEIEAQFLGFLDPKNILCAAKCAPKAGYVACLARCLLDGQACDGGIDNCS